jgi:hypothetical protein
MGFKEVVLGSFLYFDGFFPGCLRRVFLSHKNITISPLYLCTTAATRDAFVIQVECEFLLQCQKHISRRAIRTIRSICYILTVLNQDINSIQSISPLSHHLNIWRTNSACLAIRSVRKEHVK